MNTTIGKAIDAIAVLQAKRDQVNAQLAVLEKDIATQKEKLLARVKKSDLDGARGKLALARVSETEVPTIEDWDALTQYVKKTNAFDLFQKRLSKEAWTARAADTKNGIPGTGKFTVVKLLITKNRG